MYHTTQRPHVTCPLIENFKVSNILGANEKRQIIFGSNETITGNAGKALTLSGLSGGLIVNADHYYVVAQKWNTVPLQKVRIESKTATGFTLMTNEGVSSVVVVVTQPTHPKATPKDAWNYCPYCKYFGFKDIEGGIVRDSTLFGMRAMVASGNALAVTFAAYTQPNKVIYGAATTDSTFYSDVKGLYGPKYATKGSLKKSLVTQMADDDYQIIITKSTYATAAVTIPPYPSAVTEGGFTLNGDNNQYYDILILGQVQQ
jgi:hypothetical protein